MIRPKHFVIEIEATTDCNRQCSFCRPCMLRKDVEHPAYLAEADLAGLLADLAACGYTGWISYCGHGEPLLHPRVSELLKATKAALPGCKVLVTTNGDFLTAAWLRENGPYLDNICWDCYADDRTSIEVPLAVRASGFPADKVAVIDCTVRPGSYWLSRAGTGWKSERAPAMRKAPCLNPRGKIFYSARGCFCLCCNDGQRRMSRQCGLQAWLSDAEYVRACEDLTKGFREPYPQCLECEYRGAPKRWPDRGLTGMFPTIDKTRFWPK